MAPPSTHRQPQLPGGGPSPGIVPLAAVALIAVVATACLASPSTAPTPPLAGAPTTPGPGSSSPSPSLPTQTDTPWGRIWDALPPSFPLPAGAVPTQTGAGPDSGEWQVTTGPTGTTDALAAALGRSGYRVDRSGPYEDGSFVLEVTAGPACRARVTIAPLGQSSGLTLVTVLFGAGCPFR